MVPPMLINLFAYDSDILYAFGNLYVIFARGPIMLSMALYFIAIFRNKNKGLLSLSEGFGYAREALSLFVRYYLRVFIGTIFFVVPGIYFLIKYSMSFMLLADNPDKSSSWCLSQSARLMRGNALSIIKLFLSYVPLYVIAMAPRFLYVYLSVGMPLIEMDQSMLIHYFNVFNSPIAYVCSALVLFVDAWYETGKACMYDILTERLVFGNSEEESEPLCPENIA